MRPGLYLHVPFCRRKCLYCDFYSITDLAGLAAFGEALLKELDLAAATGAMGPFDTLYLGGGTPSLLPEALLADIFARLARRRLLTAAAEITLEANPDDVTPAKLTFWRQAGVNRLSLGVQSCDDAELRFLGRRHTARQALQALAWAREAGFANLSVDLIYGLPGQARRSWEDSLQQVLAFRPEHLSCYQLTLTPQTPLGARLRRGEVALPTEEEQRQWFLFTAAFLTDQGYRHYEIANFACTWQLVSRHNSKYWRHVPYLGLGPAAHSFDGRRRRWNVRSVEAYCRRLAAGRLPTAGGEVLSAAQLRLETLALGLRTCWGVPLAELAAFPQAGQVLPGLCQAGLVRLEDGRVCPTPAGMVVADSLAELLSTA